jgi:hypothetical protein
VLMIACMPSATGVTGDLCLGLGLAAPVMSRVSSSAGYAFPIPNHLETIVNINRTIFRHPTQNIDERK